MRSSRVLAPLTLALGLGLAGTVPVAPATAKTDRVGAAGATVSTRVGSYNIYAPVSVDSFERSVRKTLPHVDILGLQEINSDLKEKRLYDAFHDQGWSFWREIVAYYKPGRGPYARGTAGQTPVMWRTARFDFENACRAPISGIVDTGNELPAGWKKDQKHWASLVRLHDRRTGQEITIIDVHLAQGVVSKGKRNPGHKKSFKMYKHQVAMVAPHSQRELAAGRTVFTLGDFNDPWAADNRVRNKHLPVAKMASVGMKALWATKLPTGKPGRPGMAMIDQIYTKKSLKPTATKVYHRIKGSDHRPIVGTYRIPVVPGTVYTAGTRPQPTFEPPLTHRDQHENIHFCTW